MVEGVIKAMNRELVDLFKVYPGVKIYGLTQIMIKERGDETETIPAVVDMKGEGKWVGVDDTAPLIVYHKTLKPMTVIQRPGYGDRDDIINVYSQAMVIYYDRGRIGLTPDQVQRLVQARTPVLLPSELENFKSVRVSIVNVSVNSQDIYQGEYQNGKNIDPGKSMIQMSYQIEGRFSKACLATCP